MTTQTNKELLKNFIDVTINKDVEKAKKFFHAYLKPQMKKTLKEQFYYGDADNNSNNESGNNSNRSDVVYKDEKCTAKVPKSFEAAQQLGQNTKWTISHPKGESTFNMYSKMGDIVILLPKDTHKKYALHAATSTVVDEKDQHVKFNKLEQLYPEFGQWFRNTFSEAFFKQDTPEERKAQLYKVLNDVDN